MNRATRCLFALALVGCAEVDADKASVDTDGVDTDVDVRTELMAEAGPDRFGLVGEEIVFNPSASLGAEGVRWSLGDGTTTPVGAPEQNTRHSYSAPGHYAVSLEVTAADGRTHTDTAQVTITWPLDGIAPRHSASVVVGAGRAFVAMPDFDAIAVVDLASLSVLTHVATCGHPRRLGWGPELADPSRGILAVTCASGSPGVRLFDVDDDGVRPRAEVNLSGTGRSPFAVVLGDDQKVYVTARQRGADAGMILAYDDMLQPDRQPQFGADLRGLAWSFDGLRVSQHRSPPDGGHVFRVDLPTWLIHTETLVPDEGVDNDIFSRGVPTYLEAMAVRPDGRVMVTGGLKANLARGLVRDGLALDDETTTRADLRMLSLHEDEGEVGSVIAKARLDDRDLVSAVAYHPRGDWLYAATLGMQTVEVFDAYDLRGAGVFLGVGTGVDGLAVTPDGAMLLAHARYDRTLVVMPLDGSFAVGERVDLLPAGGEVFDADVLRGAKVFHTSNDPRMSLDGYTSCASCHLDGEEDGQVWDFTDRGEGLRNTISLRGMDERAGGPLHWSGNFDEVQDFEHDIRGPQAGLGFLADADWQGPAGTTLGDSKAGLSADLDALAAYVESLTLLDVPRGDDVSEGQALFEDDAVGCASCHPSGGSVSGWVDGEPDLMDVGTLRSTSGMRLGGPLVGLNVPSLHGVWATPPYLHDGSAATLADVVTPCAAPATGCNPDDLHGTTSHLDAGQRDALVNYLRSL